MSSSHVYDLVAPYALGALNHGDRERVEAHLAICRECATLAAEAESTAVELSYSVTPYKVPAELKETILQKVEAENQHGRSGAHNGAGAHDLHSQVVLAAPDWARPDRGFPWSRLVFRTIPLVAATIGWVLAALLIIYSHGQSDRLATTTHDFQSQIVDLTAQRDNARTVQDYLVTPGVRVLPLIYQAGHAPHTTVALMMAPGYAHAVIAARGLAIMPANRTYEVWAHRIGGPYVSLGTLVTSGPRAEGVSLIVGPEALDQYNVIGLSLEYLPLPPQPSAALSFLVKL